MSKKSCID